jgi:hypothetical protein
VTLPDADYLPAVGLLPTPELRRKWPVAHWHLPF